MTGQFKPTKQCCIAALLGVSKIRKLFMVHSCTADEMPQHSHINTVSYVYKDDMAYTWSKTISQRNYKCFLLYNLTCNIYMWFTKPSAQHVETLSMVCFMHNSCRPHLYALIMAIHFSKPVVIKNCKYILNIFRFSPVSLICESN